MKLFKNHISISKFLFISSFLLLGIFLDSAHAGNKTIKTVSLKKIMKERDTETPDKKNPRYCNGHLFAPCVCAKDVSKAIMYRPSVKQCKGNAAIILHGKYADAFSAVLRDEQNRDRIPFKTTVNGCSMALAHSENPPNRCSVFKAQSVIRKADDRGKVTVHCMGTRGDTRFGLLARRITIKLEDRPNDSSDPLVRACLKKPTKNLN